MKFCLSVAIGAERKSSVYEVLCYGDYKWVTAFNDYTPVGAIKGGHDASGIHTFYIGRGWLTVEGRTFLVPGKISKLYECLFVAFDGQEFCLKSYEVLVKKKS